MNICFAYLIGSNACSNITSLVTERLRTAPAVETSKKRETLGNIFGATREKTSFCATWTPQTLKMPTCSRRTSSRHRVYQNAGACASWTAENDINGTAAPQSCRHVRAYRASLGHNGKITDIARVYFYCCGILHYLPTSSLCAGHQAHSSTTKEEYRYHQRRRGKVRRRSSW